MAGGFSPRCHVTDSGSGEAVCSVIMASHSPPADLLGKFRHTTRLVDSDAAGANHKGQRLVQRQPLWQAAWHLHIDCFAHKVHQAASRCFKKQYAASAITGINSTSLLATSAGNWPKIRQAMDDIISEQLIRVTRAPSLSSSARSFRDSMVDTFKPDSTSGQVALFMCASIALNSDWRCSQF